VLPERQGPRPRTTPTNPHSQLDQQPTAAGLGAALAARAFALPGVRERPSAISVPGARALWLDEDVAAGPAEAFLIGREFAHLHPPPDGSLHLALPRELAAEAVATGWAEEHPIARTGLIPPTVVMAYAPRDAAELDVIAGLVAASHRFACGESTA
jgi:Family of unknown function (DUF5519)